ncbi:hypothetical protein Pla123a_19620 [Posidoniimonas polymericola]|uniref:Tetratricopeptide repeat protein n=1 Tax=Posidoniimonas polymericola TaxID=2528002 RepID=A0A5C5YQT9_9BACT|nr:hypothetical protein [Posidoniimonas polymericola]TWT77304.1 hypothetical protein Pla123a_19620 [Posidoniimonas polymericola]
MTSEEIADALVYRDYEQIVMRLTAEGITDECGDDKKKELLNRSLGLAALRMGDLDSAHLAIEALLGDDSAPSSRDYCELASLYWMQSKTDTATSTLQKALKCHYGDAAGNLIPALLCYYFALRLQDVELGNYAEETIRNKLRAGISKNWPGPIGCFLADKLDEGSVMERLEQLHPIRQPDERCRFDFYRGVKALERQDSVEASCLFAQAVGHLGQKTWTAEFNLAKHELVVLAAS